MKVKSANHGFYAEVGINHNLGHIRLRIGTPRMVESYSVVMSVDDARFFRRALSTCIRELAALGKTP